MVSMSVGMVAINGSAKPLLVINEDNDHYFKAYPPTKEALEAYVDGMTASGRVTHIVFCACGQRASFDSKTWEPIWRLLTSVMQTANRMTTSGFGVRKNCMTKGLIRTRCGSRVAERTVFPHGCRCE